MKRMNDTVLEKLVGETARDFLEDTGLSKLKLITRVMTLPAIDSPAFLAFGFKPSDTKGKWLLDITCNIDGENNDSISRLYIFFDQTEYRFVKDFHVAHWTDDTPEDTIEWEIDASDLRHKSAGSRKVDPKSAAKAEKKAKKAEKRGFAPPPPEIEKTFNVNLKDDD